MGCKRWTWPRSLATAWCLSLLLFPHSGFARKRWTRATTHLKLLDKYEDYEFPLHSHGTSYQKNDRCPPPPQTLPDRACEVPSCRSDSECERHKRCCYNGCIYACLESVPPPPVLDWLIQPKPRWLGGNGWLLDGPEEVLQAEACSTTEDGDEPLHCPTGYECHIINPGNAAEGIPNRGQCIKLRGNSAQYHHLPNCFWLIWSKYEEGKRNPNLSITGEIAVVESDYGRNPNQFSSNKVRVMQLQDGRNLRPKYYKEYFGSSPNTVVGYAKQQQKHLG